MVIGKNSIIGNVFFLLLLIMYLIKKNREFLYFLQKITMIFIISFVEIGDTEDVYPINKVIICIFICIFSFSGQIKTKPFITKDLNRLNSVANTIMILTLLFALFSAICENLGMQIFFLIALIGCNCYFLLIIIKSCLVFKFFIIKNSKITKELEKYIGQNCIK